jgi:hypothetical protein
MRWVILDTSRVRHPGITAWVPSYPRFPSQHAALRRHQWLPWSRQWKLPRVLWRFGFFDGGAGSSVVVARRLQHVSKRGPQPRGLPRRALLLFPLYVVPDFCVLFRSQGKTAKGALGAASPIVLLWDLSHFECSPVVVKGPQLSDYASAIFVAVELASSSGTHLLGTQKI